MKYSEDLLFRHLVFLRSTQCYYDKTLYLYRHRSSSAMNRKSENNSYENFKGILILFEEYSKLKSDEISADALWHCRQGIALSLTHIVDKKIFNKELKGLKQRKIYPYPLRKKAFNEDGYKGFMKVIVFLLPFEPMLRFVNLIYSVSYKMKNKH